MPILNRRETLTFGLAGAAGLAMPTAPEAAATMLESARFPEPCVNRYLRSMEGLSRRGYWLRHALLQALDDFRAELARARDGDPNAIPEVSDDEDRLRSQAGAIIKVAELTHFHNNSDQMLRRHASELRLDNFFFQLPLDYSHRILVDLDQPRMFR